MRILLLVIFISVAGALAAQSAPIPSPSDSDFVPSDTVAFHYPYYGKRIPPFLGIVAGYDGFSNPCWEAGLIFHVADYYSEEHAWGAITGFAVTYKQSLSNSLKTLEAEAGIYTPFSLGVGFSENFYDGTRAFGFRPFLGTSWYHVQVLAGYSFYSSKQSYISELSRFTVKIRYALPVTRLWKAGITNPGNNY